MEEDILKRLEKLEKENRRIKTAGFVILLGAGVVFSMGQKPVPKVDSPNPYPIKQSMTKKIVAETVEAKKFTVTNDKGNLVAELASSGEGGALLITGHEGQIGTAELKITKHGPKLLLLNTQGVVRVELQHYYEPSSVFKPEDMSNYTGLNIYGKYGDDETKKKVSIGTYGTKGFVQAFDEKGMDKLLK